MDIVQEWKSYIKGTKSMNSIEKKIQIILCFCLAFSLFAFAESSGYVRLMGSANYKVGFAGATWSETVAEADIPNRDYLVADGYYLTTVQNETVPARSLTFGELEGTKGYFYDYYSTTFENEGVVFANGECYIHMKDVTISGNAAITSPEADPFLFYGDGDRPRGITLDGKVTADEGCGLLAYSNKTNGFYLAFAGDVSEYLGSVSITSRYDAVGIPFGADLILKGSATDFGGSIIVGKDATFKPEISATVDSLTFESGSAIDMCVGTTLTVGRELNLPNSLVTIRLDGTPDATVSEVTKYALITMPADCDCSVDDFNIEDGSTSFYTKTILKFVLSEDQKSKTLYAVYYPRVELVKGNKVEAEDPDSSSAENYGEYWSDEEPVHSEAHYYVKKISGTTFFTTRYAPDEALPFAGESLTFGGYTRMRLRIGDFSVPYMRFVSGNNGSGIIGLMGMDHVIRSKFESDGTVDIQPRKGGMIKFVGPINGTEDSKWILRAESASTSQCRGLIEFDGDNTGYLGKIQITLEYPEKLNFDSCFTSLIARRGENLGGPRSEFMFDALQLDSGSRLEAHDSFTLSEATRGIFVDWQGRFWVAEDKTLTIKQQLTVNGRVYKEGAGTLELGGDLRFLDEEESVIETIPADASNRTFFVVGGYVKPIDAYALDGLDVVFSNKTSKIETGLMLDIEPEDQDIKEKGICNIKSPSPFEFRDDDATKKIPVRLVSSETMPPWECTFAVMTVKAGNESVFDRLQIVRPEGFAMHKVSLATVADETAGTVTLKATLKRHATVLSIR